jgi:hypothetical protein
VPADENGRQDVYQYEPEGVGMCTSSMSSGSAVFVARDGGCVALISSGASSEESTFLEASETGGDVFFLTTSKLAPQDFDHAYDVYDAHECTAASPCLPAAAAQPPPCDTEASCRAAPTPQPDVFGTPASGTFSGPGNITSPPLVVTKKAVKCSKGKRLSHGKCIKARAKRRKKAHKAKKSSNNRRVSR